MLLVCCLISLELVGRVVVADVVGIAGAEQGDVSDDDPQLEVHAPLTVPVAPLGSFDPVVEERGRRLGPRLGIAPQGHRGRLRARAVVTC